MHASELRRLIPFGLAAAALLTVAASCGSSSSGAAGPQGQSSGKGTITGSYGFTGDYPAKGNFSQSLDSSCSAFATATAASQAGYALSQPFVTVNFKVGTVGLGASVRTEKYRGPGTYSAVAGVGGEYPNGVLIDGYQTGVSGSSAGITFNADASGHASFHLAHPHIPPEPGSESGSVTWSCR